MTHLVVLYRSWWSTSSKNVTKDLEHKFDFNFFSASVTVALQILTKGEVVDDWFQLRASHSRTEAGTIRIKARYMVRLRYI